MRKPIEPDEIVELEALFGPIPRRPARRDLSARGKLHWWAALERDRRAEVVLLLPRPGDRLVLITKPDYPGGVYRLPTGGVDPEESVLAAASREALEESGLTIGPERLLGVVDWTLTHGEQEQRFASYLCLFPITAAPPRPTDPAERISAYREILWRDLPSVTDQLRRVPPSWASWGEQRALPHAFAFERLTTHPTPSR